MKPNPNITELTKVSRLLDEIDNVLFDIEVGRRSLRFKDDLSTELVVDEMNALLPAARNESEFTDILEAGRDLYKIGGERLLDFAIDAVKRSAESEAWRRIAILEACWARFREVKKSDD